MANLYVFIARYNSEEGAGVNSEEGGDMEVEEAGVNMPGGSNHNNKTMRGGGGYNNNKTMRGGNKDLSNLKNRFLQDRNPNTEINFETVFKSLGVYDQGKYINGEWSLIIYLQLTLSGLTDIAKYWLYKNQGYYIYPYVVTSVYLAIHGQPLLDADENWIVNYFAAMKFLREDNNTDINKQFKEILINVFNIPCPSEIINKEEVVGANHLDWAVVGDGKGNEIYVNVDSGAAYDRGEGILRGKWQWNLDNNNDGYLDDTELGRVDLSTVPPGSFMEYNEELVLNTGTNALYDHEGFLWGFMRGDQPVSFRPSSPEQLLGVTIEIRINPASGIAYDNHGNCIGRWAWSMRSGELVPTDCPDDISFFIIQSVYKNIFAYIPLTEDDDDESIFSNKYNLLVDSGDPIENLNFVYNNYINIIDTSAAMYDGELEDSFYLFINQMRANDLGIFINDNLGNPDAIKEIFISLNDLGLSNNKLFESLYKARQDVNVTIAEFVPIFHIIKYRRLLESAIAGRTRSADFLSLADQELLQANCIPFLDEDINELQSIIINNFRSRSDSLPAKFIFHRFENAPLINFIIGPPTGAKGVQNGIFFINIDHIFVRRHQLNPCIQANLRAKMWTYDSEMIVMLDTFFNDLNNSMDRIENPVQFENWVNIYGNINTDSKFEYFQNMILIQPQALHASMEEKQGGSKTKKMKKGKKTKRNKKKHKKVKKTQKRFKKHKGIKRKKTQKRKISKKIKKTQKRRRRNKNNKTT